jgi:hypothetical protein
VKRRKQQEEKDAIISVPEIVAVYVLVSMQ